MEPVHQVSSPIIQQVDIRIAVENLLSTNKFVLKSYVVSAAGDGILGIVGNHSIVTVTYELNGNVSNVTLFAKSFPVDNKERAAFNEKFGTFEREVFIYNTIFNQFTKLKESKRWRPECFHITDKLLIFEDLNIKGYRMRRMTDTMDEKHCLKTLTALARFHASSLIHEETQSDKEYRLEKKYGHRLNIIAFNYENWFRRGVDIGLKLAKVSEKYGKSTPHFTTVAEKWHDIFKNGILLSGPSDKNRNVLIHADLWTNNMMYRYDDEGNPMHCLLVDYQTCHFSPPAMDVMSFLYLNVELHELNKCIDAYLKYYYGELSTALSECDIDIEKISSWNAFRESCTLLKQWGMGQSLVVLQHLLTDVDDVRDAMQNPEAFTKLLYGVQVENLIELMEHNPSYKKRMMSMIDEFIETYIIKY